MSTIDCTDQSKPYQPNKLRSATKIEKGHYTYRGYSLKKIHHGSWIVRNAKGILIADMGGMEGSKMAIDGHIATISA